MSVDANINDPEYRLMKDEVRNKTTWSYIWTAVAAASAAVTVGLMIYTGMGPWGFGEIAGVVMAGLASVAAGFQSYSYDTEIENLRDKIEVHLTNGNKAHEKELQMAGKDAQLATAISGLQEEVRHLNNNQRRSEWTQRVVAERLEQKDLEPTIH